MWKEDAFLLKTAKQVAQPWHTHSICIQFIFITYKNQTHTACTSNCMSIHPYFYFCSFIFIVLSFLILHSLSQNIVLLFKSMLQVFWFYFCVFFSFFRECYFHNFFVLSIVLSLFRLFGRFHLFVGKCALYEPLSHSLPKTHSHGNVYILAVHVAVAMPLPLPLCQHSSLTWAVCVVCSKQQALF